jgi:hypothetical protein
MGPRVASDEPAGLVGRSCCSANRAEEGNAAKTRRVERLDRQGSGKRADAEIAKPDGAVRVEEGGAEGKGLVSARLPAGRRTKEESAAFVGFNSALAGSES